MEYVNITKLQKSEFFNKLIFRDGIQEMDCTYMNKVSNSYDDYISKLIRIRYGI